MLDFDLSSIMDMGIGSLITFLIIKTFIPSYLSQKGKNLATQEDISDITTKVESVRSDYAKSLEILRNENQLKQLEIEREKNIKKDVFLQASVNLINSINYITKLTDLNLDLSSISAALSSTEAMSQIHIVGSENTVKVFTAISGELANTVLDLLLERHLLTKRKTDIEIRYDFYSKSASKIDVYIEMMTKYNLEGSNDKQVWDSIIYYHEAEIKNRDSIFNEIEELQNIHQQEIIIFAKKCSESYFRLAKSVPDIVFAIRDELNFPISKEAYLNLHNSSINDGYKILENFYSKLNN